MNIVQTEFMRIPYTTDGSYMAMLNELGRDRWEMCNIVTIGAETWIHLRRRIFKTGMNKIKKQ